MFNKHPKLYSSIAVFALVSIAAMQSLISPISLVLATDTPISSPVSIPVSTPVSTPISTPVTTTPTPNPTAIPTAIPTPTPTPTSIPTPTPTPMPISTISVNLSTVVSGNNITASWNVANASKNDYIQILTSSNNINAGPLGISPSNNCNLNNVPGTTAISIGSCLFTSAVIGDLGTFKLAYYNSSGVLLATSANFNVTAASTGTLTASPSNVLINSQVNLAWNGINNAHSMDYINYLNADNFSGTATGHTYWPGNNCAWFNNTMARISGNCSIETPIFNGRYKLILRSGSVAVGQPAPILAVSNVITVSSITPTPTPTVIPTPTPAPVITQTLRPNSQGTYKSWDNAGCPSTANNQEWDCVDETSPNTSDRVQADNPGKKESFRFSDLTESNIVINKVTLSYYGIRFSPSRYKFTPIIVSNRRIYDGSSKSLGSQYSSFQQIYTNNPKTNKPWTVAEVNNLEAGMRTKIAFYQGAKIAQMFATVEYATKP